MMLSFMTALTFAFTSCSKTASHDEGDTSEAVDGATEAAGDAASDAGAAVEGAAGDAANAAGDAAEGAAEAVGAGSFAWSSGLSDWVSGGSGTTSITLDGLGDEESGLSESGKAQLDVIAAILEANEGVNAVIKGHSPKKDTKAGDIAAKGASKARAIWTKAKLIIGHDAVSKRISTEGVGSNELLEGTDPKADAQRRVTVTFTK